MKLLVEACHDQEMSLVVNHADTKNPGMFSSGDMQAEKTVVLLNSMTPLEIKHHFLLGMLGRGTGGIILVSSLMGFQGVPCVTNYSATNVYLPDLTETLHYESKTSGVEVLVLAAGAMATLRKYLREVDCSKLPVLWMSAEQFVDVALKKMGEKVFVISGIRIHNMACFSGGLWCRGWVQGVMHKLTNLVLRVQGSHAGSVLAVNSVSLSLVSLLNCCTGKRRKKR